MRMDHANDSNIVVSHIFRGIFGRKCSFVFKIYYFCSGSPEMWPIIIKSIPHKWI